MKRLLAFLLVLLMVPCYIFAESSVWNPDYEHPFLVGRDIAAGEYLMTLSPKEGAVGSFGIAGYLISRPVSGTYKVEIIQPDDFLTVDAPTCTLTLKDGDSLHITCPADYAVTLTQLSGGDIVDRYPGAIDGVHFTKAINLTLAYVERNKEEFEGLKSVTVEYDSQLPSINIMMHYETGQKRNFEKHLTSILWLLNISCRQQNPSISESTPYLYGGIYKDKAVLISVYDDSILYSTSAFDTYYITPGENKIEKHP